MVTKYRSIVDLLCYVFKNFVMMLALITIITNYAWNYLGNTKCKKFCELQYNSLQILYLFYDFDIIVTNLWWP
jgi:hypothetical protein